MIIDNPIFTISLPLIAFSVTNVFLAWRVRTLERSIEVLQMSLCAERGIIQMLIKSDAIKIASPSTQTCQ